MASLLLVGIQIPPVIVHIVQSLEYYFTILLVFYSAGGVVHNVHVVALYTKKEFAKYHICHFAIKLDSFLYLFISILLLRSWNIMKRTVPFRFLVHTKKKAVEDTEMRTRKNIDKEEQQW